MFSAILHSSDNRIHIYNCIYKFSGGWTHFEMDIARADAYTDVIPGQSSDDTRFSGGCLPRCAFIN